MKAPRSLASLTLLVPLSLLGCNATGPGAQGDPVAIERPDAIPLLTPSELLETPADERSVRIHADLADLSYAIHDANPTEYSWEGLRLGLDDDRFHGPAVWIELTDPVRGPVRVDPRFGAVRAINTLDGEPVEVACNPHEFPSQRGEVELVGRWIHRERMHDPILELHAVRRPVAERERSADARMSDRARLAISAEADRRLDALAPLDGVERSIEARRAGDALTRATGAQLALVMAELHGTHAERERLVRTIEAYAGDRSSWAR